ncbi:MAG: hypothetical protein LC751_18780 [Actinobacteria bacterium]|nr:hypothetical protein [Actinomycetota bacterium]MCA1738751.1 hypothetical protein [Actinomycetota bacterium]
MKRIKLVLAVVVLMTTMLSLSTGSASADACFDEAAKANQGIGPIVGEFAKNLAGPRTPGSTVPAQDPAFDNEVKQVACE